ncbi:MAG TPA: hypothetical protein VK136_07295 [Bacillota bacterium]|nr:hypothetical protein [Bacillota bacterium]
MTKGDLLHFLKDRFAKWRLPDDIVFMDHIPKTSVGKFFKTSFKRTIGRAFIKQNTTN